MAAKQSVRPHSGTADTLSAVEKQHKLLLELNGGGTAEMLRAASELLGAPLCLWSGGQELIASWPDHVPGFDYWNTVLHSGQFREQAAALAAAESAPLPEYTVMPIRMAESAPGVPCAYAIAELPLGGPGQPGCLAAFAWNRSFSGDDVAFLALAGSLLAAEVRKSLHTEGASRMSRTNLIRDLLRYKPGLRPAMLQRIYMEELHDLAAPFRVIYLDLSGRRRSSPESYCTLLGQSLDGAWILMDGDKMLAVFNEELISPREYFEPLRAFLHDNQLSACISAPFDSLLDLRHHYEIAQDCFSIASRKEPQKQLFFSEEYMLLAFLAKCQRHFALDAYYPNGLKKLLAAQPALGYDAALTLHTYFNCHCSVNATANALYIHRNTALHRLSRMQKILCMDLDDPNVCLYLHLALHMLEQSPEAGIRAEDARQNRSV